MRRLLNVTVLLILCAGCFAGCDEQSLIKTDKLVQDANAVAGGARALLESPAGQMMPPDWRLYGALGVALTGGLVSAWEEWRNRMLKKTTKAIVKGIEQTDNPQKATSEVKSNIAEQMMQQGGQKFYDRANKIVDRLKIG